MGNKQKPWITYTLGLLVIGGSILTGCSSESNVEEEIVATVGTVSITEDEWRQQLESTYGEQALMQMVDKQVLAQAMEEHGLTVTEEELSSWISWQQRRSGVESEEAWISKVEEREGIPYQSYLERERLSLALEKLAIQQHASEEEVQKYYKEHQSTYEQPVQYLVSAIFTETKEEAEAVYQELHSGSSWEAVAGERVTHPLNAIQGGDLGYISTDTSWLPFELIDAVTQLPVGELSDPIPLEEGYAVAEVRKELESANYTFTTLAPVVYHDYLKGMGFVPEDLLVQLREQYQVKLFPRQSN